MSKKSKMAFFVLIAVVLLPGITFAEEAKCIRNKSTVIILRDNGEAVKAIGNTKVTGTWASLGKQYQLNIDNKTYKVAQSKFKDCEYNPSTSNFFSGDMVKMTNKAVKVADDIDTVANMAGKKGIRRNKTTSAIMAVPAFLK